MLEHGVISRLQLWLLVINFIYPFTMITTFRGMFVESHLIAALLSTW